MHPLDGPEASNFDIVPAMTAATVALPLATARLGPTRGRPARCQDQPFWLLSSGPSSYSASAGAGRPVRILQSIMRQHFEQTASYRVKISFTAHIWPGPVGTTIARVQTPAMADRGTARRGWSAPRRPPDPVTVRLSLVLMPLLAGSVRFIAGMSMTPCDNAINIGPAFFGLIVVPTGRA